MCRSNWDITSLNKLSVIIRTHIVWPHVIRRWQAWELAEGAQQATDVLNIPLPSWLCFQVGMAAQWNVTCTQCDYSKNYVAGLLWAVVLLLEIHSCHKFQGLPATVKSHVPLCAVFQCYSCRVLHEPHLKSNVCFFAVEDLGLIEPVRLTQTCSLSVAVSAGLAKSCGLAGNVHMFVSTYVS